MKVFKVIEKLERKDGKSTPALLKPQAGPLLSKYEKKVLKNKIKHGYVPMFLRKQAE